MAHNPLLGSRISLISKKNIRYEGTLYSINEADATVALQNVRAYGTEGREVEDEGGAYVAPQDQVHPYLLFRGCDIKDLHVHEQITTATTEPPAAQAKAADTDESTSPDDAEKKKVEEDAPPQETTQTKDTEASDESGAAPKEDAATLSVATETAAEANDGETGREDKKKNSTASATEGNPNQNKPKSSNNRRNRNKRGNNPKQMVGSGASLLNRKARGVVDDDEGRNEELKKDFDFESNLAEFTKTNSEASDSDAADAEETSSTTAAYSKDDFFDSISNDVMDRASGIDHRIRGKEERNLNTETFGATSLGNSRRYRRRGGRGGNGGRGRGGRGRGRGRGGRGRGGRGGRGRQYGDGGIAAASGNQAQPAW